MPGYSFIICTYNRANYLRETIQSILTNIDEKFDYEILVINNNSPDNTANVVQEFSYSPLVKYFLETNQGLSHARNRGIKEAKKEILIFLDDDIDIEKNYLDQCNSLFSNPSVNIAGGKVLAYGAEIPDWLPKKYYYLASMFDIGNEPQKTNKLMGANYGMRKEAAHKIGWYNTELGRKGNSLMGGEENDYFNRAQQLGYEIFYDPQLIVYHKIANKLNKDYIFSYARSNGKSEAMIELKQNKPRFYLKIIKSLLMLLLYYAYGFYATNPKQQADFKIKQLYALGYLEAVPMLFQKQKQINYA